MKKIKSLLLTVCACVLMLSVVGQNIALAANKNSVGLLDLVRLKKHLAGIPVATTDFDYNKDGKIDSRDLVALVTLIMYPEENQTENAKPDVDKDGYYNEVVKPQLWGG